MAVYIPTTKPEDFYKSFARTARQSIAPALELQFFAAQNAVQNRMDKDIKTLIEGGTSTAGETAHLTRRLAALAPKLAVLKPFAARTTQNETLFKSAIDQLGELRDLADPSTAAAFETKRAEILDTLDKLRTAGAPPMGMVDDGLRQVRADTIAAIDAIVTNGFAAPADISGAQDAIDSLTATLTEHLTLVELASDTASGAVTALNEVRTRVELEIEEIESAARKVLSKKITDAQSYYARILTSLSLSLDAAVNLTTTISTSLNPDTPPQTGTVIDFIS